MTLRSRLATAATFAVLLLPGTVFAHPGNTAGDGCHYCRTNCDRWGEKWNERHCHGGYAPAPSYNVYTPPAPKPSCPANADMIFGSCVCRSGYAAFKGSCVKMPANAHAVDSPTDAWECDAGYREVGDGCVQEPLPVVSRTTPTPPSSAVPAATPVTASVTSGEAGSTVPGFVMLAGVGGTYWYVRKRRLAKRAAS